MNAKDLRIVFMGTPEFAVPSLRALVRSGYNVVGVVILRTNRRDADRNWMKRRKERGPRTRIADSATGEVARSGLRQYDGGVAA